MATMGRALAGIGRALLLILALGLIFSWITSYRSPDHQLLSWKTAAKRYTLRAQRGWIVLYAPPTAAAPGRADELIARLSNRDFGWSVSYGKKDGLVEISGYVPTLVPSSPPTETLERLRGFTPDQAIGPLLQALEDPERFAAAHDWLGYQTKRFMTTKSVTGRERFVISYEGLEAEITPPFPTGHEPDPIDQSPAARAWRSVGFRVRDPVVCQPGVHVRYDAAQIPRLRREWHRRLDVPLLRVPHAVPALLLLLPPLVWANRRWRAFKRARHGL
jgi:hypothetical protein